MPTPNPVLIFYMSEQKPSERLFLSQAASCKHRRYLLSFPCWRIRINRPKTAVKAYRQEVSFKHYNEKKPQLGIFNI